MRLQIATLKGSGCVESPPGLSLLASTYGGLTYLDNLILDVVWSGMEILGDHDV